MLSERIRKLETSGIRKIFDMAAARKGEILDLSIGQPDFEPSEDLKEEAKKMISSGFNKYLPTKGLPELREKISLKLKDRNGIDMPIEDILVTSGVSGGIFLALSAIIDPGDEIILPDPAFLPYAEIIKFLGGIAVRLDTYPDFMLDCGKLEELISKKTKALILNSPCNPTGKVMDEAECGQIAQVADKYGLVVISDEIYEYFDYEAKFFSIGSIYPNTITINGFSKSHSITGWRVGYACGPKEIMDSMAVLQQYTFVCAPSFAQYALLGAFDKGFDDSVLSAYCQKKDKACLALEKNFEFVKPEGAFYIFVKKPAGMPDFIEKSLSRGVLVVPGEVFSRKDSHFRLSFATDAIVLEKALEKLCEVASGK